MATYQEAVNNLVSAAKEVFDADPRVHAIGVTGAANGYHYRAIRNASRPVAFAAGPNLHVAEVASIPVAFVDASSDPVPHLRMPHSGVVPLLTTQIPEQQRHRPLSCGLQIENYDDDVRTGEIAKGYIVIGTLGCFVALGDGSTAILSNNHVVAGENRGAAGKDRITQAAGDPGADPASLVAKLTNFVRLQGSPAGASPSSGTVVYNDVDAGVAGLEAAIAWSQSFLPSRRVPRPSGTGVVQIGDDVYKVGRTTGLTYGQVVDSPTIVGPIAYGPLQVWFRNSFTIEGNGGGTFSDHGDSGSAILRKGTGEVLGLLYAGNGSQTFACPIGSVLTQLNCTLR